MIICGFNPRKRCVHLQEFTDVKTILFPTQNAPVLLGPEDILLINKNTTLP